MCETLWDEELTMIVFCQFYSHMLTISWRTLADIYCYIEDSTLYAAYQFALGVYGGRWKCKPRITP